MIIFILIPFILAYVFVGSIVAARHHTLQSRKCNQSDHFYSGSWGDSWCSHTCVSVWWYGPFWPIALTTALGFAIGESDRENRTQRRRARELEEAAHKAKLARYAREEDEDLDRRLAALERKSR